MSEIYNFSLDAGTDEDVVVYYRPNEVAFNLTGYTAEMHLRETPESSDIALTLTTANGKLSINEEAITMLFRSADTVDLKDNYYYDLIATSGSSPRKIVRGVISFNPLITRS